MTPITPKTFDNRLVLALVADFLTNEGYLVLHELECADYERHTRRFFRCTLDGDIPALILLSPCYRDEWTISVVLWPMESGKSAPCFETEEHTGLAYFRGWLNRWMFDG